MDPEQETADSECKPDYVGIGDPSTVIAQKTDLLRGMTQSMSLPQLKLLDICLGRINSCDPEHRWVRIERDEIAEAFGVKITTLDMLQNFVRGCLKPLEFADPTDPRNMIMIMPFDMARLHCDQYGACQIDLRASEAGMEYIFHPDRIEYLKYRLHNVLKLQHKRSYLMYLYLESKRPFCNSWIVSVDELKSILMCSSEYPEYRQFNAKILKKAQSDIHRNTATRFKYEPIRRGRWIVRLQITLIASNGKDESQPHAICTQTDVPKQLSTPTEDML